MSESRMPAVSSLSPRVLRVLGSDPDLGLFGGLMDGLNTYVVGTGPRRILIDTGIPQFPEYVRILEETMKEHNFQIGHIIITHLHKGFFVGVKNIMNMIGNKYECKVWKLLTKEDKKRRLTFPLNALENNQEFHIDGATIKIRYVLGHKIEKIFITLEEEKSLFNVACFHGERKTELKGIAPGTPFVKLALELKPNVIFPAHGPVMEDFFVDMNNFIKEEWEVGDILFNMIDAYFRRTAMEQVLVNRLYEMLLDEYNLKAAETKTYIMPLEPKFKAIFGSDLKKLVAHIAHQSLMSLEENDRLMHVCEMWRVGYDPLNKKN